MQNEHQPMETMKPHSFVLLLFILLSHPLHAEEDPQPEPAKITRTVIGWEITATHLFVEFAKKDKQQLETCIAADGVRFRFGDTVGTCDVLEYDAVKKAMVLRGNPTVAAGPDVLRGGKLIYRLETKRWMSTGGCAKIFLRKDGEAKLPLPDRR